MTDKINTIFWDKIDHLNDYTGSKMGMWFFLCTEILLFTGLFLIFFMYFILYRADFLYSSSSLDLFKGTFNTVLLLSSSLTMALSIAFIRQNKKTLSVFSLLLTILAGIIFLINKYFEWELKINHGIYPNSPFLTENYSPHHNGVILFYGLYYFMTGLHAFHVLIGLILLLIMLLYLISNKINQNRFVTLEISGLYWHLVDLIWIYLFPIFYLLK